LFVTRAKPTGATAACRSGSSSDPAATRQRSVREMVHSLLHPTLALPRVASRRLASPRVRLGKKDHPLINGLGLSKEAGKQRASSKQAASKQQASKQQASSKQASSKQASSKQHRSDARGPCRLH